MSFREVVYLIVLLVICGAAWTLLKDKIAEPFRTVIYLVIAVALLLYLLTAFHFL